MFRTVLLIAWSVLALGTAWAQDGVPSSSADIVSAQAYPSLEPIPWHGDFQIAVQIKIKDGWHINGRDGLPEGFIPLDVSLAKFTNLELAGPIQYPAGNLKTLGGETKPFPVYENEARVIIPVRLRGAPKPMILDEGLVLKVQACNDQFCLRPSEVPVTVRVHLAAVGETPRPVNAEMFTPAAAGGPPALPSDNIIVRLFQEKGVLLTFLLVFLGGLALNLTPCVYPMIPITVSYFGTQRAEKPLVVLGRALAYVVGISVTYSSLGVTAALTGRILGSTLQSPWVLGGISLLLVILSLSMFGLYEIQAPSWLLNKVAAGNTQGWIGALGMGLAFGIVAAPCVDPFSIGLLTFVAAKANPYLGFILFFTLSLGLGFPYLWLGFFSTELQRLPKSGMWMVWVKKVFGMILLGMPLYFLNPLLPKGYSHFLVPGYLVCCGLLLGWVFSGAGVNQGFKRFQHLFGVLLVILGLMVYRNWPQVLELPFQAYDPALLQQAQKGNQPVLIDFTASWCLPCREMELKAFSDPKVHEALKNWVLLKADLTQYSSPPVEALKKTYGIMGVPTFLFIGPDGHEKKELRAVGFLLTSEFLQKVSAVSR